MKKKGLIISTIVMVVVLIASLTTATYAWFSTSNVTSLQDFTVTVATDNNVNIGFKKANSFAETASLATSLFVTGRTTYTRGATEGQLGGTWAGTDGLSSTVTHNIQWGAQKKAVAAQYSSSAIETASTVAASYDSIGVVLKENAKTTPTAGYEYYSINAANASSTEGTLMNATKAYANYGASNGGSPETFKDADYVYMFLGVSPNKTLTRNQMIIAVDWTDQTGSNIGILSAIHVAYRLSKNGDDVSDWTDVDLFGNGEGSYHFGTETTAVTSNLTGTIATAYVNTYLAGTGSVPAKTYCTVLPELSHTLGEIDQIELIIYIDGTDGDCNNSALSNISGTVKIFFDTAVAGA